MATAKVVLVTGANSGIGYEAVKALLESSKAYHVLVGSRTAAKAEGAIDALRKECPDAKNTMEPLEVDISTDESIEKAYQQVSNSPGRLDVLMNNAGATFDLEHINKRATLRESFMKSYNVNVAGTHVLSSTFMPLLLRSSDPRLIFVTGLSSLTQASEKFFPTPPQPAGWPKEMSFETIGYRCTKVALNMLMLDYNHKLQADGVKVWCVGPGMLVTNLGGVPELGRKMGAGHPRAGGDILRRVVEGERDADVGKIVIKDGKLERF